MKIKEVELLEEISKNPDPLIFYAIAHEIIRSILNCKSK